MVRRIIIDLIIATNEKGPVIVNSLSLTITFRYQPYLDGINLSINNNLLLKDPFIIDRYYTFQRVKQVIYLVLMCGLDL